jgi:hypothetical protein
MNDYQAPTLTDRQSLHGTLGGIRSYSENGIYDGSSDAEIKHGVQPVTGYEAPAINDQRDLDGHLQEWIKSLR